MDVVFKDLTEEQAQELVDWYCEQGEQQFGDWIDIRGCGFPPVYMKEAKVEGDTYAITCKGELG